MRQCLTFVPTLRDVPADAEATSHQLLLRAGFIRQNAAGVYSFLPLGKRVLNKVEAIIREEMDAAGAQELLMPAIQPAELWHETGRWDVYGPELMRLKDRHDRDFALGATGEEMVTSLIREVHSYKKLPMILYQIQTKYRDEKRPRFGLLRGREFIMKDAYSFDTSNGELDHHYQVMYEAYQKVFSRCGLDFRAVIADSGAIGGKDTQEFHALAEIGEDTIAYSDSSTYASNIEMAEVIGQDGEVSEQPRPLEKSSASFPDAKRQIRSQLFLTDHTYVLVLSRGDHEVNETKVKNVCSAMSIKPADEDNIQSQFGVKIRAISPFNVPKGVKVIADHAIKFIVNGVFQNQNGNDVWKNVNPNRDLKIEQYADLRFIREGDPSPDGKGNIRFAKGIEIGQIFKLGTRYSGTMGAEFLDENGETHPMIMGCYGIGVSRTIAAIIEQNHDENGIIWPVSVAPFDIHLVVANIKNDAQREMAEQIYAMLNKDYEVLYDDRNERAGVKFADADLIGIPVRIIVGKKAAEGIVEIKQRRSGESTEVKTESLLNTLKNSKKP